MLTAGGKMMSQLPTVKNIPVPPVIGRGGREPKYPFRTMAIGDCIELFTEKELAAARNAAYREKQKNPDWNYGAVEYGPNSEEWERDDRGNVRPQGRRVYGRLWRVAPDGQ
jgi:hypothetical protein